jgi:hypothetical protein
MLGTIERNRSDRARRVFPVEEKEVERARSSRVDAEVDPTGGDGCTEGSASTGLYGVHCVIARIQ